MNPSLQEALRALPKVDALLADARGVALCAEFSRVQVTEAVRACLEAVRGDILRSGLGGEGGCVAALLDRVEGRLRDDLGASLRRVINATGIVLHTNLGRAPLAEEACAAIAEVASGYSNVEFDLDSGERGSRYSHVEALLCRLTGAEAALVVNNNAAAVVLAINTLAKDGEVITSRGELVEIGGSFRIPEVIERSEAGLVEVGTTNKTRAEDFAAAITDATRVVLKVHPSNYRIVGFTEAPTREALVALAESRGILAIEDLGSGTLVDLSAYGLPSEPTVRSVVETGMHIVTFSGDKLLGGPQAGIVVGRADLVGRMKSNPLLRALRVDKLTLAALEATLRLYLNPDALRARLPVLRMLTVSSDALRERAQSLADDLGVLPGVRAEVVAGEGFAGGGSLPEERLPSWPVEVRAEGMSAHALQKRLRDATPPIVARVANDCVLLDVRTVRADEMGEIVMGLGAIVS